MVQSLVQAATGEIVSAEELGARMHTYIRGSSDQFFESETSAFAHLRNWMKSTPMQAMKQSCQARRVASI